MMRFAVVIALVCASFVGVATGEESAAMHPDVLLLDAQGRPVARSGAPVSTERSCGACHDTHYIDAHSYHVGAGHETLDKGGVLPWERGTGWLAGWDPISYRTLSHAGDERPDLDVVGWLKTKGARHPGGGFAKAQGVQHDCFVCHLENADVAARRAALTAGKFPWATTATLSGTGLVERTDDGYRWRAGAFGQDGKVDATTRLRLGAPTSEHCGACHGPVAGVEPVAPAGLDGWNLETRGQLFSGQRLSASGLNLSAKADLARPFDVHAERLLECTSCHHAANRPGSEPQAAASRPAHLAHDPRHLSIAAYLRTPNHAFARGRDGSMRNCEDCHAVEGTHEWLPHLERHVDALRCEACHVPEVHVPARKTTDWTVLTATRGPRITYRGTEGDARDPHELVSTWQPVLLPRQEPDGRVRLTPYNVMAAWYWLEAKPERPVRQADLEAAFFDGERYHADIVRAFDANGDGTIGADELRLDDARKTEVVRGRLEAVGVVAPTLAGGLWPYALHHTVATGAFALRDCTACHGETSRIGSSIDLGQAVVEAPPLRWQGDARVRPEGRVAVEAERLRFIATPPTDRYVVGRDRVAWIDHLGLWSVLLVLIGAGLHGSLRFLAARRRRRS